LAFIDLFKLVSNALSAIPETAGYSIWVVTKVVSSLRVLLVTFKGSGAGVGEGVGIGVREGISDKDGLSNGDGREETTSELPGTAGWVMVSDTFVFGEVAATSILIQPEKAKVSSNNNIATMTSLVIIFI